MKAIFIDRVAVDLCVVITLGYTVARVGVHRCIVMNAVGSIQGARRQATAEGAAEAD